MKENNNENISKFLSLVLRHKPETIGIDLDENGWTNVQILIEKLNQNNFTVDLETLKNIVATNNKKRFAFNQDNSLIRANQGHSISIELGLKEQMPPDVLLHGTAERFAESILKTGLIKQQRQHVHLSTNIETAKSVGARHGKPIIFEIAAKKMFEDGFIFYVSDNGVWLTDNVPVKYISTIEA